MFDQGFRRRCEKLIIASIPLRAMNELSPVLQSPLRWCVRGRVVDSSHTAFCTLSSRYARCITVLITVKTALESF